jgi:hypothetical protein
VGRMASHVVSATMTEPPGMFSRPTESSGPLPSVRSSESIVSLHRRWSKSDGPDESLSRMRARVRNAARVVMVRILGQKDHDLLGELIRAADQLAERCDELSDRVATQQVLTAELADTLGQEVTRLRAAVAHLEKGSGLSSGSHE